MAAPSKASIAPSLNTTLDMLTAYVSVRSVGKKSLFAGNAEIRASTIENYSASLEDNHLAIGKLVDMGFTVRQISEISVRVTGASKLFNKHFGLKFEKSAETLYVPTDKTAENCMEMGSPVFEGMVFPQPTELHGPPRKKPVRRGGASRSTTLAGPAAAPPALRYHHLNVPTDVARLLNATPVHAAGNKGEGIRAAMIDSGFHWSHPYFQNRGYDLKVALPLDSDTDANGHGTGESANLLATAPKVKLFGLAMDDTLGAFARCRTSLGVQLISNSWGSRNPTDGPMSGWDPYWTQVLGEIALCARAGIIVLFSGGNGGISVTASTPDTISVGGVYVDAAGTMRASDYASSFDSFRFSTHPRPKEVHVPEVCGLCGLQPAATYIALPIPPGCEIDKARGGGRYPDKDETTKTDGWGVFSGTSAACPMVAGVVALILKAHPRATLADVRRRLYLATDVTAGASYHGDIAGPGYDKATGYGLVDAARAVA